LLQRQRKSRQNRKDLKNSEQRHVESWRKKKKESLRTKQQQQEQQKKLLINLRKEF